MQRAVFSTKLSSANN